MAMARCVRLGLLGGLVTVFVAAVGMVEDFADRRVVEDLSLGALVLLTIPPGFGYLAGGRPGRPRQAALSGVLGGTITGAGVGTVLGLFVVAIVRVDVRDVLINVTPALAADDDGPRLLTFGQPIGVGLALVLALDVALGGLGAGLGLMERRWRQVVVGAALWVFGLGLLRPFVEQVLRGVESELHLRTTPIARILYADASLRIPAALLVAGTVVVALTVLRRPDRVPWSVRLRRWPPHARRRAGAAALVGAVPVVVVAPAILGPFLSEVLGMAGIFALLALGLNVVVGYAGLLDLGYVVFFAVGAYTTAVLTTPVGGFGPGWGFLAAVPFVVVVSVAVGVFVGSPVLGMRGDYLAVVTLGFGEIARLLFQSDWLAPTFGGAQGLIRLPDIALGPVEVHGPQAFLYLLAVLLPLGAYVSHALQHSRIGRAWVAVREDETAAEAVGVDVVGAKLSAFVVGAIFGGIGGALFAAKVGSVFPHSFDVIVSVTVLVVVIVGGMASVRGVVLGAFVLVGVPQLLREFEEHRFLLYGALLVVMMLRRPEGLVPSTRRARELHEAD